MEVCELRQEYVILVCSESDCKKNGCKKVCERLKREVRDKGLEGNVRIQRTKCMGRCGKGPNVLVYPASALYSGVKKKKDVEAIVRNAAAGLSVARR